MKLYEKRAVKKLLDGETVLYDNQFVRATMVTLETTTIPRQTLQVSLSELEHLIECTAMDALMLGLTVFMNERTYKIEDNHLVHHEYTEDGAHKWVLDNSTVGDFLTYDYAIVDY